MPLSQEKRQLLIDKIYHKYDDARYLTDLDLLILCLPDPTIKIQYGRTDPPPLLIQRLLSMASCEPGCVAQHVYQHQNEGADNPIVKAVALIFYRNAWGNIPFLYLISPSSVDRLQQAILMPPVKQTDFIADVNVRCEAAIRAEGLAAPATIDATPIYSCNIEMK